VSGSVDVERRLSGEAGLAGVRALLHGDGSAAVTRDIRSMLREDQQLHSMRIQRVHFKPRKKLAVYYEVRAGELAAKNQVAVTWYATPQIPDERFAAVEAEIRRRRIPTPFASLWAARMHGALLFTVAPLDPVFPSLSGLADPGETAAVVRSHLASAPKPAGGRVEFVRYRPGQRHVLAYGDARAPSAFVKLYRPGESQQAADVVTAFARLAESLSVPCLRMVEAFAVLAGRDALLYERLPGRTLSEHLRKGRASSRDTLAAVGRWMRALHSYPVALDSPFPRRDLAYESARVIRACAAMQGMRPDLAAYAAVLVYTTCELLGAMGGESDVAVHGDMKADHVVCAGDDVGILDADSCAAADPALDLGKLLADLSWWTWQSGHAEERDLADAALLSGYLPAGPRLARARLYAALFLIKMAARRVSVARRDWATRTRQVLGLAAGLLPTAVPGADP